jgi:hypothetical protein
MMLMGRIIVLVDTADRRLLVRHHQATIQEMKEFEQKPRDKLHGSCEVH